MTLGITETKMGQVQRGHEPEPAQANAVKSGPIDIYWENDSGKRICRLRPGNRETPREIRTRAERAGDGIITNLPFVAVFTQGQMLDE